MEDEKSENFFRFKASLNERSEMLHLLRLSFAASQQQQQ